MGVNKTWVLCNIKGEISIVLELRTGSKDDTDKANNWIKEVIISKKTKNGLPIILLTQKSDNKQISNKKNNTSMMETEEYSFNGSHYEQVLDH